MTVLEWICEEPSRVLITTFFSLTVFSFVQLILCINTKNKFIKLIPIFLISLLSVWDIAFSITLISARSEGLNNMQWLVAVLVGVPLVAAWIGILVGWLISKIFIKRLNKTL